MSAPAILYSVTCAVCAKEFHGLRDGDTVQIQYDSAGRCTWHTIAPAPPSPGDADTQPEETP